MLAVLTATAASDIDTVFTAMVQNRVGALLVGSDPFFANRRQQLIALAAQHAIPTIYADDGSEVVWPVASWSTETASRTIRLLKASQRVSLGVGVAVDVPLCGLDRPVPC